MKLLRQARNLPTDHGLEFHVETARWHFPGGGKSGADGRAAGGTAVGNFRTYRSGVVDGMLRGSRR